VEGKITGTGALLYADGDKYEGELKDGKMHGRGVYTYASGDRYEGEWKDDRRHGKGKGQGGRGGFPCFSGVMNCPKNNKGNSMTLDDAVNRDGTGNWRA
jgi:hypothetical protein